MVAMILYRHFCYTTERVLQLSLDLEIVTQVISDLREEVVSFALGLT